MIMGVESQYDLGGTKVLPEKLLESCQTNQLFFLSKLRCPPKKRKKRSLLKLSRFFCTNCGDLKKKKKKKVFNHIETFIFVQRSEYFTANLPERHEIAQNFDAILPKEYEIARNFEAKSPKIYEIALDTVHQPGGPLPPTSYAYGHDNLSPYFFKSSFHHSSSCLVSFYW